MEDIDVQEITEEDRKLLVEVLEHTLAGMRKVQHVAIGRGLGPGTVEYNAMEQKIKRLWQVFVKVRGNVVVRMKG